MDTPMDDVLVAAALKAEYGLDAVAVEPLGGEVDLTFRAGLAGGDAVTAKVVRGDDGAAELDWRTAVLDHMAAAAPQLPLPRLVRATSGAAWVELGPDRRLQVLSWLPGRTLGTLRPVAPRLRHELGTVAGTLCTALSTMRDPRADHTHPWDLRRADELVAAVWDVLPAGERAVVERAMAGFAGVRETLATLSAGITHHDLNDANVLVERDAAGLHRISGVLDVGEVVRTARVCEVAITAAYAMLRTADPLRAAADVVRGFGEVVELQDDEIAVIFPLARARLCMNHTIWSHRLAAAADAYATVRSGDTYPALLRLDAIAPSLAEATFRQVLGRAPRPAAPVPARPATGLRIVAEHLAVDPAARRRRATRDGEPATLGLGVRLAADPGTRAGAPLAAVVERADAAAGEIVLRHDLDGGPLWSRWSGIGAPLATAGATLQPGDPLGSPSAEVRVVLVRDPGLAAAPLPSHVQPWTREVWAALAPDPAPLFGAPPAVEPDRIDEVARLRDRYLGRSQRYYYSEPMNLVASDGMWFYDEDGLGYLDVINNVTHVGHADPTVAAAVSRQVATLNTNSRFVYSEMAQYARRLAGLLPDPLEVVFFACTGSEANDLALRMARQVTGREDVLVIDGAYHGNTTAVTGISPDRFDGPGGRGAPPSTHVVLQPNRYRGPYGYDDPEAGTRYAGSVRDTVAGLVARGTPPAAFFAESLMGTAGQIVLPDGYLAESFAAVRAAGGLCVSDEVQVGLGRLGEGMWGFVDHGVVPDIVTMGKPMGNGIPLSAVVTTRAIADAFDSGMRYFNTFGGNPVSCAAGMAVLDVLERRGLPARAAEVGQYLLDGLQRVRDRHELVGDVRGKGLYAGVELVRDRASREPAAAEAAHVSELLKEEGVVMYPNGRLGNILKIKPPMVAERDHIDQFVSALDAVLAADW